MHFWVRINSSLWETLFKRSSHAKAGIFKMFCIRSTEVAASSAKFCLGIHWDFWSFQLSFNTYLWWPASRWNLRIFRNNSWSPEHSKKFPWRKQPCRGGDVWHYTPLRFISYSDSILFWICPQINRNIPTHNYSFFILFGMFFAIRASVRTY